MADVFVSYARSDRNRVAPLVAAIEARGWSVWWDPRITPGQEFDRLIDAEIRSARAVLVAWTPASVDSRWVRGEAREGADRGILVPVRFDRATLPIDFRAFHSIDVDPAAPESATEEMLRALEDLVSRRGGDPPGGAARVAPALPPLVPASRITICVLPFANLGGDGGQDYFSDGITEDIITELSRWRMLAVRSRSASFRYRGVAVDIARVARELDVRFIVEGSVRRLGEHMRITAQLIDAGTGEHVWGEKFDRNADELFAIQDQLVRTIVSTLVGRMQASDVERLRRRPPTSLAAYECVLRGNALPWDDPEGLAEATRLFEQAIEIDPDYGFAHALLAAVRLDHWEENPDAPDNLLEEAHALAKRGIALDPNESTCFSILAQACLYRREFALALQYMERAVALNPTNAWNTADMGYVLIFVGEAEQALAWFERARQINLYFDPPWYFRSTGQALMALKRYAEALAMFDQVVLRTPRVNAYMAACHARLGHDQRARASAAACLAGQPAFSIRRFMSREAWQNAIDAEHLAESLRMAGLPE
ncbi:MAG TPA: TIR domain-containing protein [Rhodanobacter sp.]